MLPISFKVATVTVVLKDILAYSFHLQMTAVYTVVVSYFVSMNA